MEEIHNYYGALNISFIYINLFYCIFVVGLFQFLVYILFQVHLFSSN